MSNYQANFNYFDVIDNPKKAYWLGFIWADGYIARRLRATPTGGIRVEYNLKLSLAPVDTQHLVKLRDDLESNYPIHSYVLNGFTTDESTKESRLFITNKHLCGMLYEEYCIHPRRYNPEALIHLIPEVYHKYFILGLLDADGSFSAYQNDYGKKMTVTFGGSEELLRFIEQHLNDNLLHSDTVHKLYRRHKDGDGTWVALHYSGVVQARKVLDYLYADPVIYLDRKYQKYLNLPY